MLNKHLLRCRPIKLWMWVNVCMCEGSYGLDLSLGFYTVPTKLKQCCPSGQYVYSFVSSSISPSRNVWLCTASKWLDRKVHIFVHICTFTRTVHLPIFIQIVVVLDFYFKDQRFESNTVANSYMKCREEATRLSLNRHNGLYHYTNRHDVKGCQKFRRTIAITNVCLIFKLNATRCFLAYCIHQCVVCLCVCVWVCVCECVTVHLKALLIDHTKTTI